MNQNKIVPIVVLVAALGMTLASSLYGVSEREQAVVVRFGEIVRVEESAGLQWKLPFVDEAYVLSARLLGASEDGQAFRSSDGKDLVADIVIKWRIIDARQFYLSVGGQESGARSVLRQTVARRVSEELGKRPLKNIMGGEWRQVTESLTIAADKDARKFGIEIVDVRLQRVGVPAMQIVFERMRADRTRLASERRAQGVETAERIRVEAERARDAVLAEGYAKAERIRGEGDARAAAIYANAAAIAPEFFIFYRSLNAYKETFKKKEDVLVLDPSSDFFKYMKKPTR